MHSSYLSLVPVHPADNIWMSRAAVKSAVFLCRKGRGALLCATDNTDATPKPSSTLKSIL